MSYGCLPEACALSVFWQDLAQASLSLEVLAEAMDVSETEKENVKMEAAQKTMFQLQLKCSGHPAYICMLQTASLKLKHFIFNSIEAVMPLISACYSIEVSNLKHFILNSIAAVTPLILQT